MTEQDQKAAADNGGKKESTALKLSEVIFALALAAAVIFFIIKAPGTVGTIAMVALGFGAVIMIHEFGHFLVAKLGGIRVEAFSIGFPPTILSLRKLRKGFRVRLFPKSDQEPALQEGDAETEYRLGLIPFGGFVKMLGQSDSGPVEETSDPRSFTNKPTSVRVAVVAAGVTFNAISAVLLFMALYLYGLNQYPAVVGSIVPNSPAEAAGIRPGDRIIAVDGESFKDDFVDFTTVSMAGALADKGQPVEFTVRRPGGQVETVSAVPELQAGDTMRLRRFGIEQAQTLQVSPEIARDPAMVEELYSTTGLRPGDVIQAVDGRPVKEPWQMQKLLEETLKATVELTVARTWPDADTPIQVKTSLPLETAVNYPNFRQEIDLANVFTMVPRMKVNAVALPKTAGGLLRRLFGQTEQAPAEPGFEEGDIIVGLGPVNNPTYQEMREITEAHKGQPLEVRVLRKDDTGALKPATFTITPRPASPTSDRVLLGIVPGFDMEHAVVAKTVETPAVSALNIPSGAQITQVDGEAVESFYDVIRILRNNAGQRLGLEYRLNGETGPAALTVPDLVSVHMQSYLTVGLPLTPLREEVKTSNMLEAVSMGARRTWYFVETTYVTIKRLLTGNLSERALSGPVGILQMSYTIAKEQTLADFLHFMGLISACLAFMNLLPIPIVDGGVIVILLIEKLKGGPLPAKVQAAITYVGLVLILSVFLWITYNDIMRWLFG